jgi:hypothetical protein
MSTLDDLGDKGLMESVEPDVGIAPKWLDDAVRHLEAAARIADLNPSGPYGLAYDAARKSIAGAILTAGHRVLSRTGSHRALAQYADSLAVDTGEQALKRFDQLRRNRSRSEYGSRTFGTAEPSQRCMQYARRGPAVCDQGRIRVLLDSISPARSAFVRCIGL